MVNNDLIQLFQSQKGYLQAKQLCGRNHYYLLKKLQENGDVVMVKRGLYRHTQMASDNDWIEVCNIVPSGVLCLFSAWQYYGLTTHIPADYHIAIPNKSKMILPTFPPIKLYYWSDTYYNLGRENHNGISIYCIEKSVCDAVKFRNKVGNDTAIEVLRNYLGRKDRNIDLLLKFAKTIRVEKVIKQFLETML
jgi:hypothetical protein